MSLHLRGHLGPACLFGGAVRRTVGDREATGVTGTAGTNSPYVG
jgi:hypothetical protein